MPDLHAHGLGGGVLEGDGRVVDQDVDAAVLEHVRCLGGELGAQRGAATRHMRTSPEFWFHARAVNQSLVNCARVKIVGPRKISVFTAKRIRRFFGTVFFVFITFRWFDLDKCNQLITQWDILP